jgi:hypothetical protein
MEVSGSILGPEANEVFEISSVLQANAEIENLP